MDYLQTIGEECNRIATAHGFWKEYDDAQSSLAKNEERITASILSKHALLTSEIGELTEAVRKPGPDQHCPNFSSEEVEAADILIRLLDYAEKRNLRISEATLAKMEYNRNRPYMHGKKA